MDLTEISNRELLTELLRRLSLADQANSTSTHAPEPVHQPMPIPAPRSMGGFQKGTPSPKQLETIRKFDNNWCPQLLKKAMAEISIHYPDKINDDALSKLTFSSASTVISRVFELIGPSKK